MSSDLSSVISDPFPPFRRIITTHSKSDIDGNSVTLLDKTFLPKPVLEGRAYLAIIFSHLGLPANSEHHLSETDVDDANTMVEAVALPGGVNAKLCDLSPNQGVGFHRTNSIDYNIFLLGSAWLITPSTDPSRAYGGVSNGHIKAKPGEVWTLVKAGEIVVQRGTLHTWHATEEGARWITVVVAAGAVEVGGKALEERDFD